MLLNPGFELDWSVDNSHRCLVFAPDGSYEERDIGNIFTPAKWVTWFLHDDTFAQPEVRDAWKQNDSRRVHSGEKATLLFTFNRCHDAGFLQQVDVEPGTRISFTAYAHAWSNHKGTGFPHPDDGQWSEGSLIGYDEVSLESVPELNGDPQNDANGNFAFVVGVDPTGGVNPYASTVVWSDIRYIYNGHHQLPQVEATATGNIITVFLRSTTIWAFKHNDAYWDDAELTIINEPPIEPPGDCSGQPRVDYERTYVLMPPGAMWMDVQDIIADTWEYNQFTIGGSADDAGIGNLSTKRVIAVQPDHWTDDLKAFFDEYYNDPPVEYWPLEYDNEYQKTGRLLAYSLRANGFMLEQPTTHKEMRVTGEFGDERDGYTHNGLDLASSSAVWGDKIVSATDGVVTKAGYYNNFSGYGWRVRVKTVTPDGRTVYVRYAHLVADSITVSEGDTVTTGQVLGLPGSTGNSTADHLHIDVYCNESKHYVDPALLLEPWEDDGTEPPIEPPEKPDERVRVGLHLQGGADGIWQFYRSTQSAVLKAFWLQAAYDLAGNSSESTFVFRHWIAHQEPYVFADDKVRAARQFVDLFRDSLVDVASLSPIPIYVCGLNEEVPSFNPHKLNHLIRFEMAFCDEIRRTHPNAYPCTFTAAVGNPHESEFELCLPLARKCEETGGLFNYHAYWWANPQVSGLDSWWKYHSGRWQEMDDVFTANGTHVKWFFGEMGAVGSDNGNMLLPDSGWKSSDCYAGNWQRYEDDIVEWQMRVREWNGTHGNRAVGGVLFTTSGPGWDNFNIGTQEMQKLAQAL